MDFSISQVSADTFVVLPSMGATLCYQLSYLFTLVTTFVYTLLPNTILTRVTTISCFISSVPKQYLVPGNVLFYFVTIIRVQNTYPQKRFRSTNVVFKEKGDRFFPVGPENITAILVFQSVYYTEY